MAGMLSLITFLGLLLAPLACSQDIAETLCGQYGVYSAEPYLYNNNAWNEDDSGSSCTYISNSVEGAFHPFYTLWQWASEPPVVHGFPDIELKTDLLPLQVSSLHALNVSASWSLKPVSLIPGASADPNTQPDADALQANGIQCNVALDMFADANAEASQTPAKQKYEIMVWHARFGAAAVPIGWTSGAVATITIGGSDYSLYTGTNSNGQTVLTWLANETVTDFSFDVAPLMGFLVDQQHLPSDVYLGTIQFGSETFYADNQMNFSVSAFSAYVETTAGSGAGLPHPSSVHTSAASHPQMPLGITVIVGCASIAFATFATGSGLFGV